MIRIRYYILPNTIVVGAHSVARSHRKPINLGTSTSAFHQDDRDLNNHVIDNTSLCTQLQFDYEHAYANCTDTGGMAKLISTPCNIVTY